VHYVVDLKWMARFFFNFRYEYDCICVNLGTIIYCYFGDNVDTGAEIVSFHGSRTG